jgi:PKD domain
VREAGDQPGRPDRLGDRHDRARPLDIASRHLGGRWRAAASLPSRLAPPVPTSWPSRPRADQPPHPPRRERHSSRRSDACDHPEPSPHAAFTFSPRPPRPDDPLRRFRLDGAQRADRQLPVAVSDGTTTLTPSPRIGHAYARAGRYRVMLTVTHLAGTSTSTVFTGHTMLTTADPAPDTRTPCRFTRSFRRPRRSSRGHRESVPAAIARALRPLSDGLGSFIRLRHVLHPVASFRLLDQVLLSK